MDELDEGSDPKNALDLAQRISAIQRRLSEQSAEYFDAVDAVARATADYERAYLSAHIQSTIDHSARKVKEHENHAQLAAIEQKLMLDVWKARERALKDEGYSLRSILSSYQTLSRWFADEAGHTTRSFR